MISASENPIHTSGSASSLQKLADTACIFCSEGEDGEKGEELVQSKYMTSCKCSYVAHLSCWHERMSVAKPPKCPSCHRTNIPTYMIEHFGKSKEDVAKPVSMRFYFLILILLVVIVAFLIGLWQATKS
jgi:hypothetical protein